MDPENGKTVIAAGTRFKGNVAGSADVYLEGECEGRIQLQALLHIGKQAVLKGQVQATHVVVEGQVEGDIAAEGRIEIRTTGRIRGNLVCQSLAIAEGAFFEGQVARADGKTLAPTYFSEKRKDLQPQ